MSDTAALGELVERFLALRREGRAPDARAFAAAHPGLVDLPRLLALADEMEGLTRPSHPCHCPTSRVRTSGSSDASHAAAWVRSLRPSNCPWVVVSP